MSHLNEDALADCALRPNGAPAGSETADHLADCSECTVRLNALRGFYDALATPQVWPAAGPAGVNTRETQLLAFATRAQEESRNAAENLAPFLTNAVAFVRERVELSGEYRTSGAVRVLAEAANAACEREPIHARNLADAAVTIANALSSGAYPADAIRALRGLAWKERANALRYLGEYDAALDALDHAEAEFANFGTRSFEFASLAYIRAVILTYSDRLDEATRQAALSAAIFNEYGDVERAMRARSVQAGVLFYRHEYREAAAVFEELLAFAESRSDAVETARQSCNAAACWIELGDATRAGMLLTAARQTYISRRMLTEVAAADWNLGVVDRVAGRLETSVKSLRDAKASCEALGMSDEAANATLDLVESLLLLEKSAEIGPLCSEVIRYYRRAGKVHQALIAAAYLKEAAGAGTIRVDMVRHVRRFVGDLDRQPELLFLAPPE
jgi:tetratricopeptide (TPR) repeat protein